MAQTYPYTDNDMVYDFKKHRYILTAAAAQNALNVVLSAALNSSDPQNPAAEVENFLNEVSMSVYEYIYSHSRSRQVIEYLLAKEPNFREVLKEAMEWQAKYFYVNANIAQEAGVDLRRGFAMTLEDLRGDRRISPYARNVLANAGLLYSGVITLRGNVVFREGY